MSFLRGASLSVLAEEGPLTPVTTVSCHPSFSSFFLLLHLTFYPSPPNFFSFSAKFPLLFYQISSPSLSTPPPSFPTNFSPPFHQVSSPSPPQISSISFSNSLSFSTNLFLHLHQSFPAQDSFSNLGDFSRAVCSCSFRIG